MNILNLGILLFAHGYTLHSVAVLPDEESMLIVLSGWGQVAAGGRGVFSARVKS